MSSSDSLATLAGRLATFERPHQLAKRRASAASKKKAQSTVTWPHETPAPEELAKAGFYFKPDSGADDNVTCFLCEKSLSGWEPGDNPTAEHLAHVPHCGWAINVSIEQRSQDMDREEEDPHNEKMMEARRCTFGDTWPHEGKKGWKCKVQKMVEAGWCYSPLPEADDCVHCFYCGVSLDGWEPKDDPWEEHRRRAPECHFFSLLDESAKAGKPTKKGKGRASRASKSSRLSTQSNITTTSEMPSLIEDDLLAEDGDTVLTTTSTTSKAAKGKKRQTKPKKGAKQTRSKRTQDDSVIDESVGHDTEMVDSTQVDNVDLSAASIVQPKTRPKRQARRSTNQAPENVQAEPEQSLVEAAPVRKTSRAKAPKSKAAQTKQPQHETQAEANAEVETEDVYEKPKRTRGKKRNSDGEEKIDDSVVILESAPAMASKGKTKAPKKPRLASKQAEPVPDSTGEGDVQPHVEESVIAEKPKTKPVARKGKRATSKRVENIEIQVEPNPEPVGQMQQPPTPPPEPVKENQTASPQSSDAENHPPSSRPSLTMASTQESTNAPPAATTPVQSPGRRTVVEGGIVSAAPWTAVDLETIFLPSPTSRDAEDNVDESIGRVMQDLTSPEKKMSVEEWILWNAQCAEDKLKSECERLIGTFESEGVRALRALEGIEAA